MKTFENTVSFLNEIDKGEMTTERVMSKPVSFTLKSTLRNRLLQKIFRISFGTLFIVRTGKADGVRLLIETLKYHNVISHYGEGPVFTDYPKFKYVGVFSPTGNDANNQAVEATWGYCLIGEDTELAFSKALGECLERQASYYVPGKQLVHYPHIYTGDASFLYNYIPKPTLAQIKEDGLCIASSNDLTAVPGFKVKSLTGDKKRFLPLEALYWGPAEYAHKKNIHDPTSSGCGAGITHDHAVLSACYELIERDHLMLYWLAGIYPNKIANDSLTGTFGTFVRDSEKTYNIEIYFLDLRYDTDVLVACCVVIDPVLNLIAMGAKTGIDAENVLKSAFLEALAVLSSIRQHAKPVAEDALRKILQHAPFTKVISRSMRVNLYSSSYGITLVYDAFLRGASISYEEFMGETLHFESAKQELLHITNIFQKLVNLKGPGYHVYAHTFDSVWLRKLSYHAARVFVPSLLKLHLNETLAMPISDRLIEFAHAKGKDIASEKDLNRLPHFFP